MLQKQLEIQDSAGRIFVINARTFPVNEDSMGENLRIALKNAKSHA